MYIKIIFRNLKKFFSEKFVISNSTYQTAHERLSFKYDGRYLFYKNNVYILKDKYNLKTVKFLGVIKDAC